MREQLSVARDIKALALINIQDIFRFTITAKDNEIEDRYGSEARAIEVAEKYLDIAMKADVLEYDLKGWSMKYSVPIKGKGERIEKVAYFYDRQTEPQTDKHKCRRCVYYDVSSDYYPCVSCVDYSNYTGEIEDEPQTDIHDLTDCDFCKDRNCKDCEGGKDEPQTEEWYTFQEEQEYNARHGKE